MKSALYDTIGKTYDQTRSADSGIVQTMMDMLQLPRGGKLLDVGCGSGNYIIAFCQSGATCTGIDISKEMLSLARQKSSDIDWIHGDACDLPWQDQVFDGATCVLATHHIKYLNICFSEIYRVLKSGSRLALFTTTAEQMHKYWLWEYFPGIMERGCREIEALGNQEEKLKLSGFQSVVSTPFFVTNALQDRFLHAGKYQPSMYLDPAIRAGISSFARPGFEGEISKGLVALKRDIETRRIDHIIQQYESNCGDYLYISALKDNDVVTR